MNDSKNPQTRRATDKEQEQEFAGLSIRRAPQQCNA
jgi:hypothetical protein